MHPLQEHHVKVGIAFKHHRSLVRRRDVPANQQAMRKGRMGNNGDIPDRRPLCQNTSVDRRSGDQMVILGQVIPIRPLRTVVSFGDLFVSFGLGAATMNALVGSGSSRRDAVGRPLHRRGAAAAPPAPVERAAHALVALTPPPLSDSPFDDPEILQFVSLLDDGRAVLDLTAASDAATDVVELSARHAVRHALERHGLPGTLLRTEPSDRPT